MRFLCMPQRGFGLVEILVVTGIAALLSVVVAVNVSEVRKKSRDAQRVSDLSQLQIALKLYNDVYGTYQIEGAGESGEGVGWVSYTSQSGKYSEAITKALYDKGFLSAPYLNDPNPPEGDNGYMLILCEEGRRYALFATKEISSDSEIEYAEGACGGAGSEVVSQYKKNYAVGN